MKNLKLLGVFFIIFTGSINVSFASDKDKFDWSGITLKSSLTLEDENKDKELKLKKEISINNTKTEKTNVLEINNINSPIVEQVKYGINEESIREELLPILLKIFTLGLMLLAPLLLFKLY